MPYVLLIFLLASATCFGRETEHDSLANALESIPKDSLIAYEEYPSREEVNVPYIYDNTKTLSLDLTKKTVTLTKNKKHVLAAGKYVQSKAAGRKIYPTGYWHYYHSNGKIKSEGKYVLTSYVCIDTVTTTDPKTGIKQTRNQQVIKYKSIKTGVWLYYNAEGKQTHRERFD